MNTPAEKQRNYEVRRSVRPMFTPKQARSLIDYLARQSETEALGTTLSYVRREVERALDDAARAALFS